MAYSLGTKGEGGRSLLKNNQQYKDNYDAIQWKSKTVKKQNSKEPSNDERKATGPT